MRFGVVGWGLRGPLAMLAHRPECGHELVALADPSEAARARFAEKVPRASVHADYRQLLERWLDAVFVLSPDWLHEEHAIAFLEAGVSVYLEKPMAISVEGCDRILEAALRSKGKLFVGHNMRYFAFVRKMREWIAQGLIGEPKTAWCRHFVGYGGEAYYRDWHADRSRSTGLLLQKGAHDIDVLHYLCGGFTRRTVAMGSLMVYGDIADRAEVGEHVPVEFVGTWPPRSLTKLNPVVDVEDVNLMLMELDNGVLASYQQCHFAPDAWRNTTVIGTEGRVENFGDAPGKSVVRLWDHARYGFDATADLEYRPAEAAGGHGGSDRLIIEDFLNHLATGARTEATPLAAREAVATGVAATQSLRDGSKPVEVPRAPAEAIHKFG